MARFTNRFTNSAHSATPLDFIGLLGPEGLEGPFSDLLKRAQNLAPLSDPQNHEFGGCTIPTREYGDVVVQRMYGFASLQFESSLDFDASNSDTGQQKYKLEVDPREIKLYQFGTHFKAVPIDAARLVLIEDMFESLEKYNQQRSKVVNKSYLELLDVPELTHAQRIAWGLAHATSRIERAIRFLSYPEEKGPDAAKVEAAADVLQKVLPNLEAIRSNLPEIVSTPYSREDFDNSVSELYGTSTDLLATNDISREKVDRAILRLGRAMKAVEESRNATAHHRRELIAA